MKRIVPMLLLLGLCSTLYGTAPAGYSVLLARYVNRKGLVAYKKMFRDRRFARTRRDFATLLAKPSTGKARKALLINAYNFFVMERVRQVYPVQKVTEHKDFFTAAFIPYQGKKISLDHLEKKILMQEYPDQRIHFALVCAAKGCPPLVRKPYRAKTLNSQLVDQTIDYLKSPAGLVKRGTTLYLSKIFQWYRDDFGGTDLAIKGFVIRHSDIPRVQFHSLKLAYLEYDWSLNGR